MTTVNTSSTETAKLTWANHSYKWNSAIVSSRRWNEMGIYSFLARVDELLDCVDGVGKSPSAKLVELLNLKDDNPILSRGRSIFETLGFGELNAKNIASFQDEMFLISEFAAKEFVRGFAESLILLERHYKNYGGQYSSTLGIVDRREGVVIEQAHLETLNVAELNSNEMRRSFASSFVFREAKFHKDLLKEMATLLSIAESRNSSVAFKLQEIFAFDSLPSKRPIKGFESSFDLDSFHGKGHNSNNLETLTISDSIDRTVAFIRAMVEALTVSDAESKQAHRKLTEELIIIDALLRKADAAIADMVISSLAAGEDIDLEAFENLVTNGAMPGYTNWRDFIPGDYEYTKALFRVIIESSTADRAQIQSLDVAVDVPDVIDRGTATVVDAIAGATVEYNRLYHVIPDVTLSAKGGLTRPTVPEFLVPPNLTGFTVRLRDTITGDYVSGTFSWSAHGY